MGLFQVVAEELQVGKPGHHAQKRRDVQEIMKTDGCRNGAAEQKHPVYDF